MGLTIREMMTGCDDPEEEEPPSQRDAQGLTTEERRAIADLKRIARRWPRSLALITHIAATDLQVARNPLPDHLADAETIDRIPLQVDYHER